MLFKFDALAEMDGRNMQSEPPLYLIFGPRDPKNARTFAPGCMGIKYVDSIHGNSLSMANGRPFGTIH